MIKRVAGSDTPVDVASRGRVLVVTLDRPEVRNAVDDATSLRLRDVFERFARDADHAVALLRGEGPDFCAGADLKEAVQRGPRSASGAIVWGGITRDFECQKPIVAALHGAVLGGGLELALCADVRIADETARFGCPEVSWGFIPGAGATQRLTRAVPLAVAMELLLSGDPMDAARAERVGLVNRVVPTGRADEEALALASRLAERPLTALRRVKEAALRGRDLTLADGLRLEELLARTLVGSEDMAEGLAAFSERRAPRFHSSPGAAEA